ncbi:MAG: chromate efflux transporter [Dichotomicrobium sp.]
MTDAPRSGTPWEVFRTFLVLGCISFGGPIAHLGYFREAFVARRKWLSDAEYGDLVALCQFLPGPASSQVGMALGLMRAGYAGMLSAWVAFTLPSALLMLGLALGLTALNVDTQAGWIIALKAAAAAVVANALLGMARNLAPDERRATIAVAGMIGAMLLPVAWGQLAVIGAGAVIGLVALRGLEGEAPDDGEPLVSVSRVVAVGCLVLFFLLLATTLLATGMSAGGAGDLFARFYNAGALVFGGGHVVLPLLQAQVVDPGLVGRDVFLAGYGAAQALPGPLFAISAYLGAEAALAGPLFGAAVALAAIFLPGALLVLGTLPFWSRLRQWALARRVLAGINAAVVGLLAAALYDPVFAEGITNAQTMALAVAAFVALNVWKAPPLAVVAGAAAIGLIAL